MAVDSEASQSARKDVDSANLHSPWRVAAQEPGVLELTLNVGFRTDVPNSEPPLQSSSTAENFRKHKLYVNPLYDLDFYLEPPQRDADDTVLEEEDDFEGPDKAMCTSIPDHLAQTQKDIFDISAFERMMYGMQNDEFTAMSKQIQVMLRKRSRELITKSRRIEDGARFLILEKPFLRLVREVAEAQNCSLHFSAEAIEALQMYAEAYLVELLTLSDRLTRHAKRVKLMPADLNLALDICKSTYQPIVPPSLIQCKSALGVLLVGLPKAGKTSILHKINLGDIGSSSADDSIRRVRYRNITFTKWTLDGGRSVSVPKSIGEEQADVLMFVVDSARSEAFDSARAVLNSILEQEHFRKSLLLVCSHKADLSAISESEIITHLGLRNLERRIWHVQCTSTVTGNGMYEALDWIVNHRPQP